MYNCIHKDALEILTSLKNLETLGLSQNHITRTEILQCYMNWPTALRITVSDLAYGDNWEAVMLESRRRSSVIIDTSYWWPF